MRMIAETSSDQFEKRLGKASNYVILNLVSLVGACEMLWRCQMVQGSGQSWLADDLSSC